MAGEAQIHGSRFHHEGTETPETALNSLTNMTSSFLLRALSDSVVGNSGVAEDLIAPNKANFAAWFKPSLPRVTLFRTDLAKKGS